VKRSNRLLILVGVFLAVIAMVGVIAVAGNGGSAGPAKGTPAPTPEPTVQVVVANTDMAFGDTITSDMVIEAPMTLSDRDKLDGVTFDSKDQVVGKVAGGTIEKGQVLFAGSSFLNPGAVAIGQDLASAVGSGKVAVSMEVDQTNGVGALLVPGDHVDVILAVWMEQVKLVPAANTKWGIEIANPNHVTAKVVIQNRKVIATLLPAPTEQAAAAAGGSATPEPKSTTALMTNSSVHMQVILEVTPDEAEVIRWAQREEKVDPQNYITLGLALRSDKDNDAPPVTTPGITFKQLVTIYGVLPPDPRAIIPVDLAKQIAW